MTLEAFVSGSLGTALYKAGSGYWILDSLDAHPREARADDISNFFQVAREVREVDADPLGGEGQDTIRKTLEEETRLFEALDGILVGMDPTFSPAIRAECIRAAEEIICQDASILQRVHARVLIPVDTKEWDPSAAWQTSTDLGTSICSTIYGWLKFGHVDRIVRELTELVRDEFGAGLDAERTRSSLIEAGIISLACQAIEDRSRLLDLPFFVKNDARLSTIGNAVKITTGLVNRLIDDASGHNFDNERLDIASKPSGDELAVAILEAHELQSNKAKMQRGSRYHDPAAIQREVSWITERLQHGEHDRAIRGLLQLIRRQAEVSRPEDLIKTLTSVADQARKFRQFEFALRVLDGADLVGSADPALICVRGELLCDINRGDEALECFRDAIRRFPEDDIARTAYATALSQLGYVDEALAEFEKAIADRPYEEFVRNSYAETLRQAGDLESALVLLKETMELFPSDEVSRNGYAETLCDLGRFSEALTVFEETIKIFPDAVVARNAYAKTLRDNGRICEAIAVLEEMLEANPLNEVSRNTYANLLRFSGDYDRSISILRASISYFPSQPICRNILAEVYRELGRFDEAINLLRETTIQFGYDEYARVSYGEALKETGQTDQALETLKHAMHEFPNKDATQIAYAITLKDMKRYNEAISILRSAVARFPRSAVAWTALATALRDAGMYDESLATFKHGASMFPYDPILQTAYVQALREGGDLDEALRIIEPLRARLGHDAGVASAYAELLHDLGQVDSAVKEYRKIHNDFPTNEIVRNALAHLLIRTNRQDEAKDLLQGATSRLTTQNDWIAFHVLSMGELRQGSIDLAVSMLARGRDEAPFYRARQYFSGALAVALIKQRKAEDAVRVLDDVVVNLGALGDTDVRLLRAHAFGEAGRLDFAQHIIDEVENESWLSLTQRKFVSAVGAAFALKTRTNARLAANDNLLDIELELLRVA